nr:ATP-binding protein [uncultured Dyadobacter sp.]
MHDTLYLAHAQALTELSFKNPALKEKLSGYKAIAWSSPAYQKFRVRYYAFLANHVSALHQGGYAIYYLQKMEEELKKIPPYFNSLNQPRQLLSIYGDKGNANMKKSIAIIDSITPFLRALPAALIRKDVSINTCINAFTILKQAVNIHVQNKDTSKVLEFRNIAEALWLRLKNRPNADKGKLTQCQLSFYLIQAEAVKLLGKDLKQADYLNAAYGIITSNDKTIAPLFRLPFYGTVLGRLIDYYIEHKQTDSAGYFLGLYQESLSKPSQAKSLDGTKILRYTAKVQAATAHYKPAYESLLKAYATNDSITAIRVADIHNNMYAHLIAEQRSEALLIQQAKIARRNNLIFGIITILVTAVAAFSWLLKINKEKSDRQLSKLNESTQIQIAQLESHANEIQKRFGMELHDDIAGKLVHLVNYLQSQTIEENDDKAKDRLVRISEMARDAYASTRSKSHEWYLRGSDNDKTLFSERVRQIVGLALADNHYEKQIEIDDHCLEKITVQTRIQMLRIIQEAVTNILKHARGHCFKLFIYEDEGAVILQIADNGRGFDVLSSERGKGLGLASMRQRAREINGSIEISSSAKGTALLLSIPSA